MLQGECYMKVKVVIHKQGKRPPTHTSLVLGGATPADSLISDFRAPRLWAVLLFKPPSLWDFVTLAPAKEYASHSGNLSGITYMNVAQVIKFPESKKAFTLLVRGRLPSECFLTFASSLNYIHKATIFPFFPYNWYSSWSFSPTFARRFSFSSFLCFL